MICSAEETDSDAWKRKIVTNMLRMCLKVLGRIVTTFRNLESFWKIQASYCDKLLRARYLIYFIVR